MISGSPAGTPIVFIVDERNPDIVAFHVTDWGNIIRAVMPPDRIPDVHLYVGTRQNFEQGQPTTTGDEQHDAISRLYLNDIRSSTTNSAGTAIVCTLPAFNPAHAATYPGCSTETNGAIPAAHETPTHPTSPANSWGIVASGVAMLLLLGAAGYGWATALIRSASGNIGFTRMALSPAFGAAALTLVAIVADRVGLRLTGPVPALATLLAGLAGYLYAWRTRRIREQSLARGKPATKIDQ
jgi:hypothetical protein